MHGREFCMRRTICGWPRTACIWDCARSIHRASAYLRHSRFPSRPSGSTGSPPFSPLVFSVVQAERVVLYIRRCFPFKLNSGPSQFHKTPTAWPPNLQVQLLSLIENTMSGTTAFSDSVCLDFERFLRSSDQNSRQRLTNARIGLIKVYY